MSKRVRAALDTNIMDYAEGIGDMERCTMAFELIAALPVKGVLIPPGHGGIIRGSGGQGWGKGLISPEVCPSPAPAIDFWIFY